MKVRSLILAGAVFLSMSGASFSQEMSLQKEGWMISEAKKAVKAKMRDPDSAKFTDLKVIADPPVVCGTVNGKNAFGGYVGPQRFLSNGAGGITLLETQMDSREFSGAWNKLCN